ncbi:MAG: squalene/phytoene synthase family protein [Steroidobacteraceae bacterium]
MSEPELTDRALVARFAGESRVALEQLFAIEQHIDESVKPSLAHEVTHARLDWWEQELTRLAEGAARHPATRALSAHCRALGHSAPDLRLLVTSARRDLAAFTFVDERELHDHFAAWGDSLFRTACLLLVPPPRRAGAERLAASAGGALRELERLSDFSAHAQRGLIFHPLGDARDAHVDWQRVPLRPQEAQTLAVRLRHAQHALRLAAGSWAQSVSREDRTALAPMLSWCALALATADDVLRALPNEYRPGRFAPMQRTWRAWYAAVTAGRGRVPTALVEVTRELPHSAPGNNP